MTIVFVLFYKVLELLKNHLSVHPWVIADSLIEMRINTVLRIESTVPNIAAYYAKKNFDLTISSFIPRFKTMIVCKCVSENLHTNGYNCLRTIALISVQYRTVLVPYNEMEILRKVVTLLG